MKLNVNVWRGTRQREILDIEKRGRYYYGDNRNRMSSGRRRSSSRQVPKIVTVTVQIPEGLIGAVTGTDSCNFRQLEEGYRVSITYSTSANEGHNQLSNEVVVSSIAGTHVSSASRLTNRAKVEIENVGCSH